MLTVGTHVIITKVKLQGISENELEVTEGELSPGFATWRVQREERCKHRYSFTKETPYITSKHISAVASCVLCKNVSSLLCFDTQT